MNKIVSELLEKLQIRNGDVIHVASDLTKLAYISYVTYGERLSPDDILDALMDAVGECGTIVIPTYNWDFCKGISFDYYETPSKTGSLGSAALRRDDFIRTKHPIYSYAVWGKDSKELFDLNNNTAFGRDSVLGYLHDKNALNILIGIDYNKGFTFAHYAEEQIGVPYRYQKTFVADYKDQNGNVEKRSYQMYVRNLDMNVVSGTRTQLLGREFEKLGIGITFYVCGQIPVRTVHLGDAYPIIVNDIKNNKSRKICEYEGQD